MTDEELGRVWAGKHGTRIVSRKDEYAQEIDEYEWQDTDDDGFLHPGVRVFLDYEAFDSHTEAYAALGAALRKLVAFADGVREVMG